MASSRFPLGILGSYCRMGFENSIPGNANHLASSHRVDLESRPGGSQRRKRHLPVKYSTVDGEVQEKTGVMCSFPSLLPCQRGSWCGSGSGSGSVANPKLTRGEACERGSSKARSNRGSSAGNRTKSTLRYLGYYSGESGHSST